MSTPTTYANLALSKIGANLIANIENEPEVQHLYDQSRNLMLRDHAWNFAESDPVNLALLPAVTPYPGHLENLFDLPGDFMRLNELETEKCPVDDEDYKVSGDRVWSCYDTLTLTYGIKEPRETEWPADFVEAFSSLLASKLARTLIQNPEESAAWRGQYEADLVLAKKNDGRDSPGTYRTNGQRAAANSPLVNARRHWRGAGSRDPRYRGVEVAD